jgi:SM-20-related protein
MSVTDPGPDNTAAAPAAKSIMPPYVVLRDFLDEATVAGLLDHAVARQADFAPTKVGTRAVNPATRISSGTRDLGNFRAILKDKILGLVPKLIVDLRVTPFEPFRLETELVAHGDGAFYKQHIDTRTAHDPETHTIRVLSGVYYFNAEPKAFSGGALRLYAIGGDDAVDFVDIEPQRNSLLVFPSWAPHEVRPVSCPSGRFIDSRFAINCWVHREKSPPAVAAP